MKWLARHAQTLVLSALIVIFGTLALPQAQTAFLNSWGWVGNGRLLMSATPPSLVGFGFGSTPSIASSNGAATFRVQVGTGGAAWNGTIGLPTASNGWNCIFVDTTGGEVTKEVATLTTNVTVQNFGTGPATQAWFASAVLIAHCDAY